MRRNRIKTRRKNKNKLLTVLFFVFLLPVISISIGYFGTKYFIAPKLIKSTYVEKRPENKGKELVDKLVQKNNNKKENSEMNDKVEKNKTAEEKRENAVENVKEEKKYTFELPAMSIFNVQVGSFSDIKYAQNQIEELRKKGFEGHIIKSNRYKVIAMSFLKRDDAEKFKERIKNVYNDAFIFSINLPVRSIKYGESGKEYSTVASNELNELINFYQSFSKFIVSNNIENVDNNTIIQFIDREINRLNKIYNSMKDLKPTSEFSDFNNNFISIVKDTKLMLEDIKKTSVGNRKALYKVFMNSLNRYSTII
ncbi:Sporulation related domain-containing protein [Caminicella sporogenes DSM 14501]|uniref:Sporulation related domain-containing protein n=1 Tax=Caminicella sporogenes DSM 14501 TaxID=1121266 RepID=A0A1M6LY47_9FIRM|nr:SPOR domain-containing protein [Caminicella sporogenes]RKD27994.1 hypothetical protein BET04_02735 [Caminicella sporogenes]WIF94403.1 SPOR domain-containing protein [Caminicella sporogenes]SHJ76102.1 Sporulation related domain-containing protein [Caminicella sporogenes DSM 14501]